MTCKAPSAQGWRAKVGDWNDAYLRKELRRAWNRGGVEIRPFQGPPYDRRHHDWSNFRAATLREARKRGLDISVTRLGT